MTPGPLVVADGGASAEAPEHTIAALELALEQGADGLALDVHLSRDDQPVVIRDFTLERTTDGAGPVRAATVRDLKRLDAGAGRGPRYEGQRIQTLQEIFERFRGRARFWINVKGGPDVYPSIDEVVVATMEIYDVVEVAVVQSADPARLAAVRRMSPTVRLGGVLLSPLPVSAWTDAGAREVMGWGLGGEKLREMRAAGLQCFGRAGGGATEIDRLGGEGIDGIVTNRPSLVRTRLGRR